VLHPGKLLQLCLPVDEGDTEDVAANVLAEDAEQLIAGQMVVALNLYRRGGLNHESFVVQQEAAYQHEQRDASSGDCQ